MGQKNILKVIRCTLFAVLLLLLVNINLSADTLYNTEISRYRTMKKTQLTDCVET